MLGQSLFNGSLQSYKTQLQQARIALCGQRMLTILPETGQIAPLDYHCHKWRECSICLTRRAEEERCRVEQHKTKTGKVIKQIEVTKPEYEALMKQLKKEGGEYRRFPLAGDKAVVLHDNINLPGKPVFNLDKLDWNGLVQTPPHKSIRGGMGAGLGAKLEPVEEAQVLVDYKAVASTLSEYAEQAMIEEVMNRTLVMNPNIITLQSCITTRIALIGSLLREHGNTLDFMFPMRKKVRGSQINWKPVDRQIFSMFFE